ncbi:MAG: hypothetical protein K0S32_4496 [Bacteroidetes bacterium]|jgi:hypothetical protein|nr:hypothetical protein [Bacteroidota bacterium]
MQDVKGEMEHGRYYTFSTSHFTFLKCFGLKKEDKITTFLVSGQKNLPVLITFWCLWAKECHFFRKKFVTVKNTAYICTPLN